MLKKLYFFLLVSVSGAFGQNIFSVTQAVTLSSSAAVVTVSQAANPRRTIQGIGASVDCAVTCSFTLEINGSPATTTAQTPANLNAQDGSPTSMGYINSNVGVGTAVGHYTLTGGGGMSIDLTKLKIPRNVSADGVGNNYNFTLRSGSMSGLVDINILYVELAQ